MKLWIGVCQVSLPCIPICYTFIPAYLRKWCLYCTSKTLLDNRLTFYPSPRTFPMLHKCVLNCNSGYSYLPLTNLWLIPIFHLIFASPYLPWWHLLKSEFLNFVDFFCHRIEAVKIEQTKQHTTKAPTHPQRPWREKKQRLNLFVQINWKNEKKKKKDGK